MVRWLVLAFGCNHRLLEQKAINILVVCVHYAPERNKEMQERGVPWIFDFPMCRNKIDNYIDTVFSRVYVARSMTGSL